MRARDHSPALRVVAFHLDRELVKALGEAKNFANVLESVFRYAREAAHDLERKDLRDSDHTGDVVILADYADDVVVGLSKAYDFANGFAHESAVFADLACDLALAGKVAAEIVKLFTPLANSAKDLSASVSWLPLYRGHALAYELAELMFSSAKKAEIYSAALHLRGKPMIPESQSRRVRPLRVARRLAGAATRVLPAANRPRYDDEYRSELYELAAAGASRWHQLMYAVRLVDRAWVLRAELRDAALQRARS